MGRKGRLLQSSILTAALFLFAAPAFAAEPAPGGACSNLNYIIETGGPETSGVRHLLRCDGAHWQQEMTIDANGRVGIGTDTPGAPLDVVSPNPGSGVDIYPAKFSGDTLEGVTIAVTNTNPNHHQAQIAFQDKWFVGNSLGTNTTDDFYIYNAATTSSPFGIGTDNIVYLNSATALTNDITPSQITANQNNYNPASLATASVLRLNSDASRNITGLQGGVDGRVLTVFNIGSNPIVIKNQSTSSTTGNRFALGTDVTLATDQGISLIYDATSQRWRSAASLPFSAPTCGVYTYAIPAIAPQPASTVASTSIFPIATDSCTATVSVSGDASAEFRTCADAACSTVINGWNSSSQSIGNGEYLQLRLTTLAVNGTQTITASVGSALANLTVETAASYKHIFITSTLYGGGNLGGVSGADAKCATRATAAGLPGTYFAWIADSTDASAPASRFTQSSDPYRRVDFVKIADNWAGLTSGTLQANLNSDEFGNPSSISDGSFSGTKPFRSNVNTDGTRVGTSACTDWTGTSGNGAAGNAKATTGWSNATPQTCSTFGAIHLLCVEQ